MCIFYLYSRKFESSVKQAKDTALYWINVMINNNNQNYYIDDNDIYEFTIVINNDILTYEIVLLFSILRLLVEKSFKK